jgi:hypothetical protein
MEALHESGDWEQPLLASLEAAQEYGIKLCKGRVFSDLWDVEQRVHSQDDAQRIERMKEINRTQLLPPPLAGRMLARREF